MDGQRSRDGSEREAPVLSSFVLRRQPQIDERSSFLPAPPRPGKQNENAPGRRARDPDQRAVGQNTERSEQTRTMRNEDRLPRQIPSTEPPGRTTTYTPESLVAKLTGVGFID